MLFENKTGLVFDDRMLEHRCIWDPNHTEKPQRISFPLKKCKEYGLIDRCIQIPSRFATEEELLLVHDKKYIEEIKSTKFINEADLEEFASKYDGVYFNNKTYDSALLSTGCTLQLVSNVLDGTVNNGIALNRPPGHHAMTTEACGYCYFNNVAIAAKHALNHFKLSRILIIDWDVHHGQATQQTFYDDPRVLYVSIHRYENGAFWPHLRESNFDYVGGPLAKGYNINVPLNGSGQGNAEYLAIFNNVILPIAYEFAPQLVLVSAGYDAAYGCPEGEMKVTPSTYSHFINSLSCLANGRICVLLEGGYCQLSLSESVALTLKSLLGDPCPLIKPCLGINQVTVDSVLNVLSFQRDFWDSIKLQPEYKSSAEFKGENHFVHVEYAGNPQDGMVKFVTRGYSPEQLVHVTDLLNSNLKKIISKTDLSVPNNRSCFTLSLDNECLPNNIYDLSTLENHSSLKKLHDRGIFTRCTLLSENVSFSKTFFNVKDLIQIESPIEMSNKIPIKKHFSGNCFQVGNYNLLQLADSIMKRVSINGFNLRNSTECSSSSENEIALAAAYLIKQYSTKRILVVNWSVDHNDIVSKMYFEDDTVLFISLHHCKNKICRFSSEDIGSKRGKGYNINICFPHSISDGDYLAAVLHVILPIAYEYCPEFIFISSNFDRNGFSISPSCYGIIVKLLSALSNGKMVIDFKDWHDNFDETLNCISSLLGICNASLMPKAFKPSSEAIEVLQIVVSILKNYWRSLAFGKALPSKKMKNFNK